MTYVRVGDADLWHEVIGAGDPVLLLHGGFCSLESMRSQAEALAVDHSVCAFERPGHGRSADVEGGFGYARSLVETVHYLDGLRLGAVDVVGYSDGAIIGLLLALRHPERVRSLVAISGNLDPSGFRFSDAAASQPMLDRTGIDDGAGLGDERTHYDRLSPDGPAHADAVIAKLHHLWLTEPAIDPAELSAITAPVLIMSGDRDDVRPDHSLLMAASIPGARLCIVPGTTHRLIAEKSALVSVLIRDFLSRLA